MMKVSRLHVQLKVYMMLWKMQEHHDKLVWWKDEIGQIATEDQNSFKLEK
jgi:hypothetical protein